MIERATQFVETIGEEKKAVIEYEDIETGKKRYVAEGQSEYKLKAGTVLPNGQVLPASQMIPLNLLFKIEAETVIEAFEIWDESHEKERQIAIDEIEKQFDNKKIITPGQMIDFGAFDPRKGGNRG